MNGNITKEGITVDLEAMKRVGVGGVQLFNTTNTIPEGPVPYLSPQWLELVRFANAEAERLGLSFVMMNGAGWSNSGGPWIKPEESMQMLAWTDFRVSGPNHYADKLPQAQFEQRIYSTGINPGYLDHIEPCKPVGDRFYRDIAVLAFPTPDQEPEDRNERSGKLNNYLYLTGNVSMSVPKDRVLNLTDHLQPDGHFEWDVPPGQWTILRLGHTSTDQFNHPAPEGGVGLEIDKFSREAMQKMWRHHSQLILDDARSLQKSSFNGVLIDSWEVGTQHWSPGYAAEFAKRRGYDPTPWLPVLSGRLVENRELTERFLWDLRCTNSDLITDHYFAELTRLCHANHLKSIAEAYGGPFDELQASGAVDVPMGEFWTGLPDQPASTEMIWSSRLSASAAHTYGKPIVDAEAFTSRPENAMWRNDPYELKIRGDWAFTQGINRYVFHRYAHQPWLDLKPGMTMGPYGLHFERTNTWWEQSRAWLLYISRCQFLLQQGRFVADVAYFPGDQAPTNTLHNSGPSLHGYDFDMLSADLLLQLQVRAGRLVLPSGMSYRALVVGGDGRLRLELVEKIRELSLAGALISCPRPQNSPTLHDLGAGDDRIAAIAAELWDSQRITSVDAMILLGQAKILPDVETSTLFIHRQTTEADLYFLANPTRQEVRLNATFRIADGRPELWYPETGVIEPTSVAWPAADDRTVVPLHLDPASSVFVVFRRNAPKLAASASIVGIERNGQTLFPDESSSGITTANCDTLRFVDLVTTPAGLQAQVRQPGNYVLKRADGTGQRIAVPTIPAPIPVAGPWQVTFPPKLGAPPSITLDRLQSWTVHPEPGVRYFSGTATYTTEFILTAEQLAANRRLELDLGQVANIAEVACNGQELGILWKPPFVVDLTPTLKAGINRLTVHVTNLWVNRLIGDEQEPSDCKWGPGEHGIAIQEWPAWINTGVPRPSPKRVTFTTFKFYDRESPLLTSGLLGPVVLRTVISMSVQ